MLLDQGFAAAVERGKVRVGMNPNIYLPKFYYRGEEELMLSRHYCSMSQVSGTVCGYAWVCGCMWDEFSECLLETRVLTSADINKYPIRIFNGKIDNCNAFHCWATILKP